MMLRKQETFSYLQNKKQTRRKLLSENSEEQNVHDE